MIRRRLTVVVSTAVMLLIAFHVGAQDPISIDVLQRTDAVSFEKEILPILQKNCLACHSASEKQGGLVLESPAAILKGGDSGAAVVPGKSADSLLLKLSAHLAEPIMPPADNAVAASNLSPGQLGLIRLWIDQGAKGTGGVESLSPRQMAALPKSLQAVHAISLTQDGQYVAFNRGNQILLHHVPTGQLVTTLNDPSLATTSAGAHRDLVQSLTFNVDGDVLASGGFREVKIWRRPKDVQAWNVALGAAPSAMTISPDRRAIAVALGDHSIRILNPADGQTVRALAGHTDQVTSLRYSEDSTRLVSTSKDQTIRIWNTVDGSIAGQIESPVASNSAEVVETEQRSEQQPDPVPWIVTGGGDNLLRLWQIPRHPAGRIVNAPNDVKRFASSADGRLIVVSDAAGNVRVISVLSSDPGLVERQLSAWKIDGDISSLAIIRKTGSPEPTADNLGETYVVAAGLSDGTIHLWSISGQSLSDQWNGPKSPVQAIAGSPDGTFAVTGCEDGSLTVWKLNQPAPTLLSAVPAENSAMMTLSPSKKQLASLATKDGHPIIVVRNLENGQQIALAGHTGAIQSLVFSQDDGRIISAADDGTIRIWDLRNPAQLELRRIEGPAGKVMSLGTSSDGNQVIAGFAENALRLYNVADGMLLKEFSGHTGAIVSTGFWNGQVYSVSADTSVRFWNPGDGSQVRTFNLPSVPVSSAVSADGQRMLIAGNDHQLRWIQTDNGNVLQAVPGQASAPIAVSISADALRFCCLTTDGRVTVWNSSNGRVVESSHDAALRWVALGAQSGSLLVSRQDFVPVQTLVKHQLALEGNTAPVRSLVVHPNGQSIIAAAADGSLRGFAVQNGQPVFSTNHGAAVHDLAISADGQFLATAGENQQVRLWTSNGQGYAVQQIGGFAGPVNRVTWSRDGKTLIAVSGGDKPIAQWHDVTTGNMLQRFTEATGTAAGCLMLPIAAGADPAKTQPMILHATSAGIWTWQTALVRQMAGHNGVVNCLTRVSGAPRQVFSGSQDGTVRRWNLDNGQPNLQFNHGGPVQSVAVSANAQQVVAVSDNHVGRLWNINGQQVAEMRGDVRRRIAQTRAQQAETSANARLNAAKQQLDVAEKDVPVKMEAEKKFTEMLTAANSDVQTKKAAVETALAEKTTVEKAAIDASAAAKTALAEKQAAEKAAKESATLVQVIQTRLNRLQQAANSDPASEVLKQKVAAAQGEMEAATRRSMEMTTAVQAPTTKATEMTSLANQAAQKLETVQKPYNDALTMLKAAESAQNLLSQQQVLAAKELKEAQDLVPVRKDLVGKAEAQLAEAKMAVLAAVEQLQQSDQALRSVAFSPDGTTILTGGDFTSLHSWDAKTGAAVDAFAGHSAPVRSIGFLDDRHCLSISDDQTLRLWDMRPEWTLERTIGSVDNPGLIAHRVTSVDFSADSTQLLVAGGIPSRRGELQIFRTSDGERTLYLPQAHDDVVYCARFSPDARRIASGGADKYLRTFDVASAQMLRRFEGHTSYVLGVAWKRDGRVIASSGADNTIKVWDADTGDQQRTIENFRRHIAAISYVGETDNVISVSGDALCRMHNAANGGLARNYGGPKQWLHCVAVTPDTAIVAAGDASGTVHLWNGNNGQVLRTLTTDQP